MAEETFPGTVPLAFLIVVSIIVITVGSITVLLLNKFYQRKRDAALSLAWAYIMWFLAILSVLIFAIIHYVVDPEPISGVQQYSRIGHNLGFAFSALSNIFIVIFVSQIYGQSSLFRRTQKAIPIINGILNGITIGFIIDTITQNPINPSFPLLETGYHLLLTFFSLGLLLGFSADAARKADTRWQKWGFRFILISALAGIMVFIFLVMDRIFQTLVPGFEAGFTTFVYLGWGFSILMILFGYLGYIMPSWLRDNLRSKEAQT